MDEVLVVAAVRAVGAAVHEVGAALRWPSAVGHPAIVRGCGLHRSLDLGGIGVEAKAWACLRVNDGNARGRRMPC